MRKSWSGGVAACTIFAAIIAAPARAEDQAAPPLVHQINDGNWLPQTEAESLVNDLFYQQAIAAAKRVCDPTLYIGLVPLAFLPFRV
jgi:hypothetical protein